jgi:peptide/nickel transport system permease protein
MLALMSTAARRIVAGIPALCGVVLVSFALTHILPGDPAVYFAGAAPTPQAIEELRHTLLLDRPEWEQLINYVSHLVHGDLGQSLVTGQPVIRDLLTRLPATLELTGTALILACLIALPLGIRAALRRGGLLDHSFRVASTVALSVPAFFSALLLVFVFYYILNLAPAPLGQLDTMAFPPTERTGFLIVDALLAHDWPSLRDALAHLVLPALALAFAAVGPLARVTRAAMLAVLSSDFIRAARSYDLPRRKIIYVYALRNALLPVLTTAGFVFSYLISANVVVEKVFAWPGVGSYALEALVSSDYAAVQGFVLAVATLYVVINIALDVLYGMIDVRMRAVV